MVSIFITAKITNTRNEFRKKKILSSHRIVHMNWSSVTCFLAIFLRIIMYYVTFNGSIWFVYGVKHSYLWYLQALLPTQVAFLNWIMKSKFSHVLNIMRHYTVFWRNVQNVKIFIFHSFHVSLTYWPISANLDFYVFIKYIECM